MNTLCLTCCVLRRASGAKLNEHVYRLFELTNEEIALIEESLERSTAR